MESPNKTNMNEILPTMMPLGAFTYVTRIGRGWYAMHVSVSTLRR